MLNNINFIGNKHQLLYFLLNLKLQDKENNITQASQLNRNGQKIEFITHQI